MSGTDLILLGLVLFTSSLLQGMSGFGFGMLVMSFLPLLIDVKSANVISTLMVSIPLLQGLWNVRRSFKMRMLFPVVPGLLLGLPLGIWFLARMADVVLVKVTGVAILSASLYILLRGRRPVRWLRNGFWSTVTAFISGFLGGAVSIGGPPIIIYSLLRDWDKETVKAFTQSFFLLGVILKLPGLFAAGLLTGKLFLVALIMSPVVVLGGWLGIRTFEIINREKMQQIICSILVVMGILLLIR